MTTQQILHPPLFFIEDKSSFKGGYNSNVYSVLRRELRNKTAYNKIVFVTRGKTCFYPKKDELYIRFNSVPYFLKKNRIYEDIQFEGNSFRFNSIISRRYNKEDIKKRKYEFIVNDNTRIIALKKKNRIWFLFETKPADSTRRFLSYFIKRFPEWFKIEVNRKTLKKKVKQVYIKHNLAELNQLQNTIESTLLEIERQKQFVQQYKDRLKQDKNRKKKFILSKSKRHINYNVNQIYKIPFIKNIIAAENKIIIISKNVKVGRFDFGAFKLVIDPKRNNVYFYSFEGLNNMNRHPYESGGGRFCFGGYKHLMNEVRNKGDISQIFYVFLKLYTNFRMSHVGDANYLPHRQLTPYLEKIMGKEKVRRILWNIIKPMKILDSPKGWEFEIYTLMEGKIKIRMRTLLEWKECEIYRENIHIKNKEKVVIEVVEGEKRLRVHV